MNKKAQGLPLTTIIIAILVILVLVIVVVFFLGGFRGITQKISGVFSKTISGSDLNFAIHTCQNYCDQAKILPTQDLKKTSAYCTSWFNIDKNNDGEAEKIGEKYIRHYCFAGTSGPEDVDYLKIACEIVCPDIT